MSQRIVFIGAAGEMARVAIERFASVEGDWEMVLTDIRPDLLDPLVRKLPSGRATAQRLDLFDRQQLRETVSGAALVVLCAGPYIRTSEPVITACLEAGVPYLDFDDDVESTEHALSVHDQAKAAGIPLYIGCGASPGMTNIIAVDAANDLDTVETIEVGWLMGEERPSVGRAVLEHMLHISAGECVTWENGRRVVHEAFVDTGRCPILTGEKDVVLYEAAHPEPVTLPRRYPGAQRIRCLGGLDPAPLNGLFRGLALAIESGAMTQKEVVDWVYGVATGGLGLDNIKCWRHGIRGMWAQVRRGESSAGEVLKLLGTSAIGHTSPFRGGLLAVVSGVRDGKPMVSRRRTVLDPSRVLNSLGGVTGTACAAFALLALEQAGEHVGAFAPEEWVEPQAFYKAMERVGVPRGQIVEVVRA